MCIDNVQFTWMLFIGMNDKYERKTLFVRIIRLNLVTAIFRRVCTSIWILWIPILVESATIPVTFNHLYSTDGLSNNTVRAIAQDRKGFVWLGTDEGLNRYNGINFTIFKNSPDDPESLSSNRILAMEPSMDCMFIRMKPNRFRVSFTIPTILPLYPSATLTIFSKTTGARYGLQPIARA